MLEAQREKYDAILKQLEKITASDVELKFETFLDDLHPRIYATVTNGSSLDVAQLQWRAELYVGDRPEPVATADLYDDYASRRGSSFDKYAKFRPQAAKADEEIEPEPRGLLREKSHKRKLFVTDYEKAWTTLEIQNASKRTVKLSPILSSVEDLGERKYLDGAPYDDLEVLQQALQTARKYESL
jgi:Asp-tRNA(Asn)/Glu-tRNA(Gln) amidotransferase A subunit family amidase